MSNIFNSVRGLHPKRNAFSAHTYRNDFTAPLGVNIPCYFQELPPATRIKVSASALVRLQALIAPVMDNIDYYTHFWKVPYRLLENDLFTQFISGEIEAQDYTALFVTPYKLAQAFVAVCEDLEDSTTDQIALYNSVIANGSLLDFLGYDKSLFPTLTYDEGQGELVLTGGNNETVLNWRGLIMYFMIHLNWYMNENVPYFTDFQQYVETLVKEQDLSSLANLLVRTCYMHANESNFPYQLLPHAWDKDYFTGALPNVQYGDPVTLPLGGTAPVTIPPQPAVLGIHNGETASNRLLFYGDGNVIPAGSPETAKLFTDALGLTEIYQEAGDDPVMLGARGTLSKDGYLGDNRAPLEGTADLSEATAITINELRFANALQVFKERQLRFGRRRLEYYKGFFDVEPEDLRLQVPKYLGGGRIPINIADIEQTSETSGSSALGHLAGKATAVAGGFAGFSTFCSEETCIIGISFAMPHITYANQLSRFKLKTNDIYDYFNPSFEHLGEQAIKKIEVYAGTNDPDGDFAYTPRYTEYRFHSNEMHGEFKNTLAYWSLGRIFTSTPALNAKFIYMQPSVFDRIFAVTGQPNMVVSMLFRVRIIQPVSKFGTPMLLS